MITLPRDDLAKQEILSEIAKKFKKGKEYNEMEVNDILNAQEVDDVSLFRRELINFGYMGRNPEKCNYWLNKTKLTKEDLQKLQKNQEDIKKVQEKI